MRLGTIGLKILTCTTVRLIRLLLFLFFFTLSPKLLVVLAALFSGVIGFLASHYIYFCHSSLVQYNRLVLFTSSL